MFDDKDFIAKFIEAVKEKNEEKMKKLAESVADLSAEYRVELLSSLVKGLESIKVDGEEDTQYVNSVTGGLASTLERMKIALEAQDSEEGKSENSTSEEVKDTSKTEEATQDVAADTGAEATEAEEGEAPAEEEKAEKTEDKA